MKFTYAAAVASLVMVLSIFSTRVLAAADKPACESVMANLDKTADLDLLSDCFNFYWHNQQFDAPEGSYNNIVSIGKRIVVVDPSDYDTWTTTAWILWSKWVTWSHNPEKMPDGATKLGEAYRLLLDGQSHNLTNAIYHWQAATTMWVAAKSYSPEFYPFVLDSYQRADVFATNNDLKIRARFKLGLIYQNELKQNAEALYWYHQVLELDPTHTGALNGIKEIGAN